MPFELVRCERLHGDIRPDFCRQYRDNNTICKGCAQVEEMDRLAQKGGGVVSAPVDWKAFSFGQRSRQPEQVKREVSVSKKPIKECACCGERRPVIGRGLCGKCYHAERKAGRFDLYPAAERVVGVPAVPAPAVSEPAEGAAVVVEPERVEAVAAVASPGISFAADLRNVLSEVEALLLEKNAAYGDSALNPVRVFSKASPDEQLRVRLDDKLSRLMRGDDAGEDTEFDLLGYLILLRIARRRLQA